MFALKEKNAGIYIFQKQTFILILRCVKNLIDNIKFKENRIHMLIKKLFVMLFDRFQNGYQNSMT